MHGVISLPDATSYDKSTFLHFIPLCSLSLFLSQAPQLFKFGVIFGLFDIIFKTYNSVFLFLLYFKTRELLSYNYILTLYSIMIIKQGHYSLIIKPWHPNSGAQWLSGRVLYSRPKGRGFEPRRRHCVVVLEPRHIYHRLVLLQHWKTRPCLTERLLTGRKEANKTNNYSLIIKPRLPNHELSLRRVSTNAQSYKSICCSHIQ